MTKKRSIYKRVQRTGRGRDGGNEERKSEGKKRSLELTEMEIDVQEQEGEERVSNKKTKLAGLADPSCRDQ